MKYPSLGVFISLLLKLSQSLNVKRDWLTLRVSQSPFTLTIIIYFGINTLFYYIIMTKDKSGITYFLNPYDYYLGVGLPLAYPYP